MGCKSYRNVGNVILIFFSFDSLIVNFGCLHEEQQFHEWDNATFIEFNKHVCTLELLGILQFLVTFCVVN